MNDDDDDHDDNYNDVDDGDDDDDVNDEEDEDIVEIQLCYHHHDHHHHHHYYRHQFHIFCCRCSTFQSCEFDCPGETDVYFIGTVLYCTVLCDLSSTSNTTHQVSIYLSIHLYIHPSIIFPSIDQSISIDLFHPSICPSIRFTHHITLSIFTSYRPIIIRSISDEQVQIHQLPHSKGCRADHIQVRTVYLYVLSNDDNSDDDDDDDDNNDAVVDDDDDVDKIVIIVIA